MAVLQLRHHCHHLGLIKAMGDSNVLAGDWQLLIVQVDDSCFVSASCVAFLCTWGLDQLRNGRRIEFRGSSEVMNYLSRLDLFKYLDFAYEEEFKRHSETGRFIPVRLINDDESVYRTVNEICNLVLNQFENSREFLPALEWAMNEIIDNIRLHSDTPVPGSVCAQFYPKKHRIDIGVCDMGRGIKASLSESITLFSHGDAVTKALQRGVSRNPEIGQGNGLAGSLEILRLNRGEFHLWTGDVDFCTKPFKEDGYFQKIPELPGTGLFLSLNTSNPVALGDTFIAGSGWSYLNAECERIQGEGGLLIKKECLHTGAREPAVALRRKIESLLPEMQEALVLDFSDVENASSSFLDELLGRLALKLGKLEFNRRIRIINAPEIILRMANTVVSQRLELQKASS